MTFRSLRLDAIFGGPLSEGSGAAIRAAVASGVAESQELDWKAAVPGDLPARACGFANAQGGAIVIGVAQTDDGFDAQPLPANEIDRARTKISQQLASSAYPMPPFEVMVVPDAGTDGRAFVVLLIPPSPDAPHAVADRGSRDKLRYPLRVDTTTEYMSEAVVASAYRNRFGRQEDISNRLDRVVETGFAAVSHEPERWLYLALVPEQRQRMTFDRTMYSATSHWIIEADLSSINRGGLQAFHPMPHVNRTVLIAPGHTTDSGAHYETFELYGDGSGFAAWQIELPDRHTGLYLSQSQLVDTVIKHVNVLTTYATSIAGISGAALVEVGIADWKRSSRWAEALNFGEPGGHPTVRVRPMTGSHSWQVRVDVGAVAASTVEMLDACRILAMGITQAFGYVEPTLISAGGRIQADRWPAPEAARSWAKERGALST